MSIMPAQQALELKVASKWSTVFFEQSTLISLIAWINVFWLNEGLSHLSMGGCSTMATCQFCKFLMAEGDIRDDRRGKVASQVIMGAQRYQRSPQCVRAVYRQIPQWEYVYTWWQLDESDIRYTEALGCFYCSVNCLWFIISQQEGNWGLSELNPLLNVAFLLQFLWSEFRENGDPVFSSTYYFLVIV